MRNFEDQLRASAARRRRRAAEGILPAYENPARPSRRRGMWAAVATAAVLGWAVGVAMPLRRDAPQEEETPMADRPVPPRCGKDTLRVAPPTPPLVAHAPQEGRPAVRPGRKSDGLRRTEMRNIRDDSVDYGLLVPLP